MPRYDKNKKSTVSKKAVVKALSKMVKAKPKKTFAQKVKAVIAKQIEVKKTSTDTNNNIAIVGNTVTGFLGLQILQANWTLIQGVGQGDRIGNEVKIKTWTFRGNIFADTLATAPACIVKMYIFKQKGTIIAPSPALDFYQDGNTTAPPQQNYLDIMRKVNTDRFTVVATKTFKVGYSANGASGQANNDFKMVSPFYFDLSKHCPKTLRYNDNVSNSPENLGLYVCFSVVAASGATGTVTPSPNMTYVVEGSFTDQ